MAAKKQTRREGKANANLRTRSANARTVSRTVSSTKRKSVAAGSLASSPSSLPDPQVVDFLSKLGEPLRSNIETVRKMILRISPTIRESIKWNAPSFQTTDYFATLNMRGVTAGGGIRLILHTGAKPKNLTMRGAIADPDGILQWLAKDRAMVTFEDSKDLKAKLKPLTAVIRTWIAQM